MSLRIDEAATLLGVSPATLRSWVNRGKLTPIRAGARPLRFDETELMRCAAERLSTAEHTRLDTVWSDVMASD